MLFTAFGVPVLAYGALLGLAFLAAGVSFAVELRRRRLPAWVALPAMAVAMLAGNVGSFAAAWLEGQNGQNWLGGFLLAAPLVVLLLRQAGLGWRDVVDCAAPGLAFAYAIARIGCHLAGDGDYGVPSSLPWAMAYPHGIVPTAQRVHPTPLYESAVSLALGFGLWWRARRAPPLRAGALFGVWLVVAGIARILVEELRLNPPVWAGLSQAQLLSFLLVLAGAFLLRRPR